MDPQTLSFLVSAVTGGAMGALVGGVFRLVGDWLAHSRARELEESVRAKVSADLARTEVHAKVIADVEVEQTRLVLQDIGAIRIAMNDAVGAMHRYIIEIERNPTSRRVEELFEGTLDADRAIVRCGSFVPRSLVMFSNQFFGQMQEVRTLAFKLSSTSDAAARATIIDEVRRTFDAVGAEMTKVFDEQITAERKRLADQLARLAAPAPSA